MSLSTALIGGVGGAIIGFFTGGSTGALQGLQVGTFVGGLIDANKSPTIIGPRLSDLTVQTSTYGAVIPRAYGTTALCGNVFWLENNRLKEVATTNKSGGKGGGGGSEYETFAYYATFAVGLCKGPIIGVKRIWIGKKLFYDAGSQDYNSIRESNSASKLFTVHTGSNAQLADDRMQSTLGVANTPAYRGLAYIVFKDLPLRDYGNSLAGAQVKVEIVKVGSEFNYTSSNGVMPTAGSRLDIVWNGNVYCCVTHNTNKAEVSTDGVTWKSYTLPSTGSWRGLVWTGQYFIAFDFGGTATVRSKDGKIWIAGGSMPAAKYWNSATWNGKEVCAVGTNISAVSYNHGVSWILGTIIGAFNEAQIVVWNGSKYLIGRNLGTQMAISTDGLNWTKVQGPGPDDFYNLTVANGWFYGLSYANHLSAKSLDGITWQTATTENYTWASIKFDGSLLYALSRSSNIFAISADGLNWETYSLISGSASWTDVEYNGGVYVCVSDGSSARTCIVQPYMITTALVPISDIVTTECLNSKFLVSGDIDVTLLSQQVRGYMVSSVAAIRAALSPLQGAFQFDIIQSGYKIKFKPRGNSSVVTVPAKDLGAEGIT